MFRDGLPAHVQILTKLTERLAIVRMKAIQKLPAVWIGKRLEHLMSIVPRFRLSVNSDAIAVDTKTVKIKRVYETNLNIFPPIPGDLRAG